MILLDEKKCIELNRYKLNRPKLKMTKVLIALKEDQYWFNQ